VKVQGVFVKVFWVFAFFCGFLWFLGVLFGREGVFFLIFLRILRAFWGERGGKWGWIGAELLDNVTTDFSEFHGFFGDRIQGDFLAFFSFLMRVFWRYLGCFRIIVWTQESESR
jgi:hypothetical protein